MLNSSFSLVKQLKGIEIIEYKTCLLRMISEAKISPTSPSLYQCIAKLRLVHYHTLGLFSKVSLSGNHNAYQDLFSRAT